MSALVRLRALVREAPPIAALVAFADPLFAAYGVEAERAEAVAQGHADPFPDELELVLETARLLWAYCALDPHAAQDALPTLERTLLPGAVRDDERAAFHVLLADLEDTFHGLAPDDRAAPLPPFDALLARYAERFPPDDPRDDAAEALARFARPLLDREGLDDPDELDHRMDLAAALWDAAHADDLPGALAAVARRFPDEPDVPALLRELMTQYRAA